ncbi:hypothetical protein C6V85_04160 [Staphylococcus aureus]|nr:hypothetical protein C6V85_04160 [Staphylococcus aureus]AVU06372.1 hypothetical protein B4893_04160 [Staphylococcus aureus]
MHCLQNFFSKFSVLGPLTRIEKSLLQAHFRSVNYCQYNFVEHRTLIYVPACFHKPQLMCI